MEQADSAHTTSRRGFLGHVAGAYLAAGAVAMTDAAADPIFGIIAEHKRLNAIHYLRATESCAAQRSFGLNSLEHVAAQAVQSEACRRDLDCLRLVLITVPTTADGMLAYLDHLASPLGFRDIEPEPDDFVSVCATVRAFTTYMKA